MTAPRAAYDPATDYYALLGVPATAPHWEIQAAYRKLAKQYHPDLNAGSPVAEARMARINRAKQILLNRDLRAAYDRERRMRYSPLAHVVAPASSYAPRPAYVYAYAGVPSRPAAPVASATRSARSGFDRSTLLLVVLILPLVAGLAIYMFEAVQMAGKPARYASDLALAPVSTASAAGTARSAFARVAGQPMNARAAADANRVIQRLADGSPEGEMLRYWGRTLVRAADQSDETAWNNAVLELCRLAEHC